MAKQPKNGAWEQVKKTASDVANLVPEKPRVVEKAGEVVQTILGTMAGVVSGIGILVTGTEAEKRARAAKQEPAPSAKKAGGKGSPATKKAQAAKKAAPAK